MSKNTLRAGTVMAVLLTLLVSLIPVGLVVAEDSAITVIAQYRQDVPVQRDTASTSELSTLDPAIGSDQISIISVENLFLGLTDSDPITNQIVPELATSWTVSEDGLTWTFNLRTDVNWMQYDPATDTATVIRPVVAGDFVFGIKRACDPRLASYYGTVVAGVIAGCSVINQTPIDQVTDDLVYGDTTQVSAPDDSTVVINLQFAAGYFLSMTQMWVLRPTPREAIEDYGDEWTQPGNIITNGPYFAQEVTRGVRRVFVRNEALPADLQGSGNIDVVNTLLIEDLGTQFALYLDNQLDATNIPDAELQGVVSDPQYQNEVRQIFDLAVSYFGFAHDKAPFDDVHARRAFSAIIDRQAFIDQVQEGRGVPMIHFTPPGMAHAAPINEVGVGFDPEYAAAELEAAGYPDCEGFPDINIVTYTTAGDWGEFWATSAEEYLGCDPTLFTIEQLEFSVLLEITDSDAPTEDRPNAWTLLWGPDYGDANNWVGDVLACTVANRMKRPCTEVDDLIAEAATVSDPGVRDQLYAEIEEGFFGADGEFPMAPLYLRSDYLLFKPWYTGPFETDGLFGGQHWTAYSIDMAAKLAVRE